MFQMSISNIGQLEDRVGSQVLKGEGIVFSSVQEHFLFFLINIFSRDVPD
jgi:hypothetical protein